MTALAVESANKNFLEACYHLFTPHDQAFPGTVLSTGTEDYFDSACKLHDDHHAQHLCVSKQPNVIGATDYFDGGTFRFPVAGETHVNTTRPDGSGIVKWCVQLSAASVSPLSSPALRCPLRSAYRFHEEDPIAFSDGVRFMWRIGDVVNAKTHAESPKCWIDQKMPGDGVAGHPQPSIVTSYAWVYSW